MTLRGFLIAATAVLLLRRVWRADLKQPLFTLYLLASLAVVSGYNPTDPLEWTRVALFMMILRGLALLEAFRVGDWRDTLAVYTSGFLCGVIVGRFAQFDARFGPMLFAHMISTVILAGFVIGAPLLMWRWRLPMSSHAWIMTAYTLILPIGPVSRYFTTNGGKGVSTWWPVNETIFVLQLGCILAWLFTEDYRVVTNTIRNVKTMTAAVLSTILSLIWLYIVPPRVSKRALQDHKALLEGRPPWIFRE